MTDHDDGPLHELAPLDPVLADAPPRPGSSRFDEILERAMTATDTERSDNGGRSQAGLGTPAQARRPRRGAAFVVAAAAVLLIIVGVVVVIQPDSPTEPANAAEALASAAQTTGDVDTLRAEATYVRAFGTTRLQAEVDGANYAFVSSTVAESGGEPEEEATTVIGTTVWERDGSRWAKRVDVPAEERNAAYPDASRAVIRAALTGSEVSELGTETVRGQESTRYRVRLTQRSLEALAALSPSQVAQFELEYPQGVEELEVWVHDDLIRRIRLVIAVNDGSATPVPDRITIEYHDFGADITITPPT